MWYTVVTGPDKSRRYMGKRVSDNVYVGPRKRTERTAMAEAVRMSEDWWERIGRPGIKYRATAIRRLTSVKGWSVTVERTR